MHLVMWTSGPTWATPVHGTSAQQPFKCLGKLLVTLM
jgi:hypothetical protein